MGLANFQKFNPGELTEKNDKLCIHITRLSKPEILRWLQNVYHHIYMKLLLS